ncbi:3'(2'),5'-bisphosphate nucleotidase CysQ [Bombella sp. ESL0378]|uniref:3'(2'),5'-bisphosphate nucleotidase CysQ family protein n=1 Tax=Bombella sp. ESL0378 TaxID=2676442 RepID=UPI0012D90068|nr:3'(2'),5'-bisphosphate nucleotidase CysQ [Bombella sp. ESL0378]MUG04994.1 3'(2'),5'-bisphosphate nucleotidase CysQ [Bombella sp. ESL0378]
MNASSAPVPQDYDLLNLALEVIDEAAAIVRDVRARGFQTDIKEDSSPVTEADKASEAHILKRLRDACPTIPAIAEEEHASGTHIQPGNSYWLIDPLDGTRGFAAGGHNFTINIGLIRDHQPVLGAVALPAQYGIYGGGRGLGAFQLIGEQRHPIKTAPVGKEGLRVMASSHHTSEDLLRKWSDGRHIHCITRLGSAAKIIHIAEGKADFYPRFGPTMEWDTAAPHAILEAAGGHLLDETGQPLRYGKKGWLNPPFFCTGYTPH